MQTLLGKMLTASQCGSKFACALEEGLEDGPFVVEGLKKGCSDERSPPGEGRRARRGRPLRRSLREAHCHPHGAYGRQLNLGASRCGR